MPNYTHIETTPHTIEELAAAVCTGREALVNRKLPEQIADLEAQTSASNIWDDPDAANALFAKLKILKAQWEPVNELFKQIEQFEQLSNDASEEEKELLQEELVALQQQWEELETSLYLGGEFDMNNCYLSITSGAGGTEAQDWAEMLARMYTRYFEAKEWQASITEQTPGTEAGIKSITIHVTGAMAYGLLKCERGTHRLVRLSPFNAKNLRQTSFALVEVLPEITETSEVEIDPSDLRVDTYRSSGAGGQHTNKTDSAVRITHLPTNTVAECQSERSQQQNRTSAMNILRARLLEKKRAEDAKAKQELKGASQSADFGQQIRSYVLHPYQMVKDLRTNYETSQTEAVLNGELDGFIQAELKRNAGEVER